jgi:ATP-dependent Clp protease ATP-binding subunit ClpC
MSVYNNVIFKEFNLTPRAKKAYEEAYRLSKKLKHNNVNNLHVFYGCIKNSCPKFKQFLLRNGVAIKEQDVLDALEEAEDKNKDKFFSNTNSDPWHKEVLTVIKEANRLSNSLEQYYIGIEHIFSAVIEKSPYVLGLFEDSIVDFEMFKEEMLIFLAGEDSTSLPSFVDDYISNLEFISDAQEKQERETTGFSQNPLPDFATSLNELFYDDKLPEVHGRDEEISSLIETISKKNKCNAILTGDAGVGKTSVVEALASKICKLEVPSSLIGVEILSVDLGSILAGTQYRGQFEQRFKSILDEAKKNPGIILFFDEIHTLFGAGSNQEGGLDAVNMLKPLLARGDIKCIGSTTKEEYLKIFNKDAAMKRRFFEIEIEEPSKEDTKSILYNCKSKYEKFHNVKFSKPIIDYIVDSSDLLLKNKKFPDKAFDILDQAGARVKIRNSKKSKEILLPQKKFIESMLDGSLSEDEVRSKFKDVIETVRTVFEPCDSETIRIKRDDINEIISEQSGISLDQVKNSSKGFSSFLGRMSKEVFGQDKILNEINNSLSCAKAGLIDSDKPLASMFFVGPTSVGKTYTAKKIAKHFFGNEKAILQVNMSELQDKTGMSKLIGSNAGYVGYEEGGMLTKFLSENPNSVVLFDEIEKASPDILNILLHILDEGYVEDNKNKKVSFSNSIVILTSNIGHKEASKKSMGFINDNEDKVSSYNDSIKKQLKPELVARISDIFVFEDLSEVEFKLIIEHELNKIKNNLQNSKKIKFNFKKETINFIFKQIKLEKLHARDIKNFIRKEVKVPVSKFVLSKNKNEEIFIKGVDNKINVY